MKTVKKISVIETFLIEIPKIKLYITIVAAYLLKLFVALLFLPKQWNEKLLEEEDELIVSCLHLMLNHVFSLLRQETKKEQSLTVEFS